MKLNISQTFVVLFFFVSPFIDALTGYLLNLGILSEGSLFSPSQLFRFLLTLFAFYFLKNPQSLFIVCLSFLFLVLETFSFILHKNVIGFLLSLVYSYKLVFMIMVFLVLRNIFRNESPFDLLKNFVFGSFLYAFILFISFFLGIDQATYSEGTFGSKGLFASGNGLSIFLGVSSVLAFYYFQNFKTLKNFFFYIIILLGAVLVGTKASIFFLAINLLLFFYYTRGGGYLLVLVFFAVNFFYLEQIVALFSVVFDVIVLRYENSPSLIAFLASNRDNYVKEAFEVFNDSGLKSLRLVFGSGVFLSFRNYVDLTLPYDTLESDFFDVFFSYGLVGLFIYLSVIIVGIYLSLKKSLFIYASAWVALCAYSLIGGHMLFNSMSNIAFLMLFLLILTTMRSDNGKKNHRISLVE